jgi:two-component SAPR family response regulator
LRALVEPQRAARGTFLIHSAKSEIKFNTQSAYWLDIEALELKVTAILTKRGQDLTEQEISEAETALRLYRGDLLEGQYSEWALIERERLRALYIDGLAIVAEYRALRGDYVRALAFGRTALRMEPLREDIHRTMMEIYARSGRIAQAVRQFESCRDILFKELGIAPAEETALLHNRITRQVAVSPSEAGRTFPASKSLRRETTR